MAKSIKKKVVKKRSETYERKVKFEDSFEDIVKYLQQAQAKKRKKKQRKIFKD